VTLDKLAAKNLPVQVDWVGRAPDDMRITEASVSPGTVRLVGASRQLESMETVYTQRLDIGKLSASGELTTRIVLKQPTLRVAEGADDRVEVSYVMKKRETK